MSFKCFWSQSSECKVQLYQNKNSIFIIGSNDVSRRAYIDIIKKVITDLELKPIFAIDLTNNNNLYAFCNNICTHIRGSRLIIIDISAPQKIKCEKCNSVDFQPSVNVYWEYGYAAGMHKPLIVLCEENQVNSVPFDIFDKHIQTYTLDNLEIKLKPLIEQKIKEELILPSYFDISKTPETIREERKFQKLYNRFANKNFRNIGFELNNLINIEIGKNKFASVMGMQSNAKGDNYYNDDWILYLIHSLGGYRTQLTDRKTNKSFNFHSSDKNAEVLEKFLKYFTKCCIEYGLSVVD